MEARAKLLGHPIHQMLIPFPLGLLSTAALFDLLHVFTDGTGWASASFYLIGAGVVFGVIAAIFGVIDWLAIPKGTRARRVGLLHGAGNDVLIVMFALSFWLRTGAPDDPTTLAILLSLGGAALGMLTGWLGGELVNRLGVGVSDGAHLDAPSSLRGAP